MKSASGLFPDLEIKGWIQHKMFMPENWVLVLPLSLHSVRGIGDRRITLHFSCPTAIGLGCEGLLRSAFALGQRYGWAHVPDLAVLFTVDQTYRCSVGLLSCVCFRDGSLCARSSVLAPPLLKQYRYAASICLKLLLNSWSPCLKQIHNFRRELAVFIWTPPMSWFDLNSPQ